MNIRPIHNDDDHAAALQRIKEIWNAADGTPESDELDILATLVDAYENTHYPAADLDPIESIKAHMDLAGYSQGDFADLIGSRPHASEILNRKRPLSLTQIQKIAAAWKIPAALLIQPYQLDKSVA